MQRRQAMKNMGLMGGAAVLATPLFTLLQSCKETNRSSWTPLFFNGEEAQLISSLVDTILPQTDTPGGLDVKVDIFIDRVYDQLYDANGQKNIRSELALLQQRLSEKYTKKFSELSTDQKIEVLKEEEKNNAARFNSGVWGTAVGEQKPIGFYRSLKSLILWGYFSSEDIGKNVLNYDPIPGEYRGCIPLEEVGRLWSL